MKLIRRLKRLWVHIKWYMRLWHWHACRDASRMVVRSCRYDAITPPQNVEAQNRYAQEVLRHWNEFGEAV